MKRSGIFLLIIILFFPVACTREDDQLRQAVTAYNTLLAEGYREMNMNRLAGAATPEQAAKVYYHMAALGEGGVLMDPKAREIRFAGTSRPAADEGEVTTEETWDYNYRNISTGRAGKGLTVHYTVRYRLVRQSDKWLVAGVTIPSTDRTDDAAELPFLKRPADVLQGSVPSAGEHRP